VNSTASSFAGDTVRGNILEYNNWLGYSAGFAAGAAKFAGMFNLRFLNNFVFGNFGPGVWCDIHCWSATITSNIFINNVQPQTNYELILPPHGVADKLGGGVVYELSEKAAITYNTMTNNDTNHCVEWTATNNLTCNLNGFNDGGIDIVESSQVDAEHNTIEGYEGAGLVMNARPDFCGGGGPNNNAPANFPKDGLAGDSSNGELYCPSSKCDTGCGDTTCSHGTTCIHSIKDYEASGCGGFVSTGGSLQNCNKIQNNSITECEDSDTINAEIAGVDSRPSTGEAADITFYPTSSEHVYANNAYFAYIESASAYTPPCGQQGSCTPINISFTTWQTDSGQDPASPPPGSSIHTSSIIGTGVCVNH
jgi:hypothetical protein